MISESTISSLWFVEPFEDYRTSNNLSTIDKPSLFSYYPHRLLNKTEILTDRHLKNHWNICWTKVVAVNELIIGLLIFIIGILVIIFQLSLALTAHGIWTGALIVFAGLFAFSTIINRRYRFFLLVASIHVIAGLASAIFIFISVFAIALQLNDNSTYALNINDHQFNYGFHITLIILGIYEKLLCYTFLIMIIQHPHTGSSNHI